MLSVFALLSKLVVNAAPIPLLDFTKEVEQSAVSRLQKSCIGPQPLRTVVLAEAFAEEVFPSVKMYYEASLCLNQRGFVEPALRALNSALEINPEHPASLYDRAEIYLLSGKLQLAKEDLEKLLLQDVVHWAVYFRRAELAGTERETVLFDKHFRRALFEGFKVETLLDSGQRWLSFVRDPELGPLIQHQVLLYGSEQLWERLQERAAER